MKTVFVCLFLSLLASLLIGASCSSGKSKSDVTPEARPEPKAPAKTETPKPEPPKPENVFPPQVAGEFYPADPTELKTLIDSYIKAAEESKELKDRDLVALVSPHAGYPYSGPVAGWSYRQLQGRKVAVAVILSLSHHQADTRAGLLDKDGYRTPLGVLKIDRDLVKRLATRANAFKINEEIFMGEHSLEVQLPFLQEALPDVRIVPIIVPTHDPETLAAVGAALFEELGKRKDVVFIGSTDLSHYFPYDDAVKYDTASLKRILDLDVPAIAAIQGAEGICGSAPVMSVINFFRQYPADQRKVTKLMYKNSGDTTGDKSRGVVGYGSVAFSLAPGVRTDEGGSAPAPAPASATAEEESYRRAKEVFTKEERDTLMGIAKATVNAAVHGKSYTPLEPKSEKLKAMGAAFVTLKIDGELRGCIGHVIARMPLYKTVAEVGRLAALEDPRFNPVTPEELSKLSYEISVLTAPQPVKSVEDIVVGRDGLIMTKGYLSGLLLPQVPGEFGWDRNQFLDHTCRKAGMSMGCWRESGIEIQSFQALVWGEDK